MPRRSSRPNRSGEHPGGVGALLVLGPQQELPVAPHEGAGRRVEGEQGDETEHQQGSDTHELGCCEQSFRSQDEDEGEAQDRQVVAVLEDELKGKDRGLHGVADEEPQDSETYAGMALAQNKRQADQQRVGHRQGSGR